MTEQLNKFWTESMGDCSTESHKLKHQFKNRWVRFHSLPESKRYAESEDEYKIIFSRHQTILEELTKQPGHLHLTIPEYSETVTPNTPEQHLVNLCKELTPWKSTSIADEEDKDEYPYYLHLHVAKIDYPNENLEKLFKLVADDELRNVMIICPESNWIFHPYDGGADVILKDSSTRDQLKTKHSDWLSSHPKGL